MSVSGLGQPIVRPTTTPNSPKRITVPTFGAQTSVSTESPKAKPAPVTLESLFQQFFQVLETLFNEVKGLLYHLKDTLSESLKDPKGPKEPVAATKESSVEQAVKKSDISTQALETPQDADFHTEAKLPKQTDTPPLQFKSNAEDASESAAPETGKGEPVALKSQSEKTQTTQNDLDDLIEETAETSSSTNAEQDLEKTPHTSPIPVTQHAETIAETIPSPKALETGDDSPSPKEAPKYLTPKTDETDAVSIDADPLKATEPKSQADFEALSHNLLVADKNLREKFAAFEERQALLPKKGMVAQFQDQFKRAALRQPGEVEQAATNLVTTFDENQTDLDEINLIARSASYNALLQSEQRDALMNKMNGFTEKMHQNIGTIQNYDRKQQTFLRMPLWSLSRANVRAVHQLDRALENYKEASEQLLNA